jgi:hypothetical protein
MMRRSRAAFIAVAALALSMAVSPVAIAATYTDIFGEAYTSGYTWYSRSRTITSPEEPGPEVVFKQYTGPNGLQMGAYRCGQVGTFPWGRYPQDFGVYQPVADGVPYLTVFCLFTLSSSGNGDFTGRLGWDG